MGFTEHDEEIIIDGLKYTAKSAEASVIEQNSNCTADGMTIDGFIRSDMLSAQDILNGLYDYADVYVFLYDYETGAKYNCKKGKLSKIHIQDDVFKAEIRGLASYLENNIEDIYSPTCRAKFCDRRCKVAKSRFKMSSLSITALYNRKTIYCEGIPQLLQSMSQQEGLQEEELREVMANGYVELADNSLCEIQSFSLEGTIELYLNSLCTLDTSSLIHIYGGCDKKFQTCRQIFGNGTNFRGEPCIPTLTDIVNR